MLNHRSFLSKSAHQSFLKKSAHLNWYDLARNHFKEIDASDLLRCASHSGRWAELVSEAIGDGGLVGVGKISGVADNGGLFSHLHKLYI